ncbi:ATP-dependent DNA helicase PIF1 [Glycine soja]|uniref:ATP-dependent DNA helicase n=1 Tax=Glycine soja TaxID=3848 RepID=A0A445L118_GLYSO|nr:ATP-dependent DNA helicase PIF1 [Glycine soja]
MGRVQLPFLKNPPMLMQQLLSDQESRKSRNFQHNIRAYNMMFAFSSLGAKIDTSVLKGKGQAIYKTHGQSCHLIRSPLRMPGKPPKFAQLYIYDTKNEIQNKIGALRQNVLDSHMVSKLKEMLDEHNTENLNLQLIANKKRMEEPIICPQFSEVVVVIVGDASQPINRDIILKEQNGRLQRINELHPSYLGLQYPLMFPYGEDEHSNDIKHRDTGDSHQRKRNRLIIKEFLCFRLHCGKHIILSLSFVGSQRYIDKLYFDGMAICNTVGFPDLFLTFTRNPNWSKIQRSIAALTLNAHDRPYIVTRVFKLKLQQLMPDLKEKQNLGNVLAYIYTIEFQKRGLSHAHILLFLDPASKYLSPTDIDRIISAEIPDSIEQQQLYDSIMRCYNVNKHIMHGPCGHANRKSPCMKDEKCSRCFPKKWQPKTVVDQEGYPVYRRRNDANNIFQEGKDLTYLQFISKFTYIAKYRCWRPCKGGNTIGRLNWVPPSTGELCYLRMMLVVVKGLTTYEQIRTVNGQLYSSFREAYEQRDIFNVIINNVNRQAGGMFFLYGYGGTGKTFMWKTLAYALCLIGDIVLTVASSGIALLLLPNGRTAYLKFVIPMPTLENSTCNIHQGTEQAEMLKATKLVICDEAPMAHNVPFGGKVIVLGGYFRQILPFIPRGSRSNIVHAAINASYLWDYCTVLKLTKNMCLQSNLTITNAQEIKWFLQWLIDVGDGKLGKGDDGLYDKEIPSELLITNFSDPIEAIVNEEFLKFRAILASTNEVVDQINYYILNIIPGEEKEYFSCDSIDMTDAAASESYEAITLEFLHSLKTSDIPNHKIRLKTDTLIMFIHNLDQAEGLCNGTRLIVYRMANHVIEVQIISGKNIGSLVYIPRMSLSPSQPPWPFKMIRRQFPFIVSYAMTINKSQGQSLQSVGLYLPKPVLSHGQLYMAFLRVQSKSGLKILIHDKEGKPLNITTNVVFKEVLQNL